MRELNVLKKARGTPYIVDLHGVFYSKHVFYIVMQYMNAGSLETLLSQHKLRHERDHPGTRFPGVPLDAISVHWHRRHLQPAFQPPSLFLAVPPPCAGGSYFFRRGRGEEEEHSCPAARVAD